MLVLIAISAVVSHEPTTYQKRTSHVQLKKVLEIRIRISMKYGSAKPNVKSLKKELSSAHAHKIQTKHRNMRSSEEVPAAPCTF